MRAWSPRDGNLYILSSRDTCYNVYQIVVSRLPNENPPQIGIATPRRVFRGNDKYYNACVCFFFGKFSYFNFFFSLVYTTNPVVFRLDKLVSESRGSSLIVRVCVYMLYYNVYMTCLCAQLRLDPLSVLI